MGGLDKTEVLNGRLDVSKVVFLVRTLKNEGF
ncbi:MAG: hypothetical protein ACD_51C00259G0010 [uncultured bacterium]|nr:MAG: hypothetical protein ACD_51C00259G0010 [uncultured bacterium]